MKFDTLCIRWARWVGTLSTTGASASICCRMNLSGAPERVLLGWALKVPTELEDEMLVSIDSHASWIIRIPKITFGTWFLAWITVQTGLKLLVA